MSVRNKVHQMEVFESKDDRGRWRSVARNRAPIATSGEGYEHKQWAVDMAKALHPDVPPFVEGDNTDR